MHKKLMALLGSIALAGGAVACKDRRYGDEKDQVASKPLEQPAPEPYMPAPEPPKEKEIDNAQSAYGVDVAGADAVAHFSPSGTNKLRGVATIDGQTLTLAVADAAPGKYTVELADEPNCDTTGAMVTTPGSPSNRTQTRVPGLDDTAGGGAADSPGLSGQGTFENTKGDHVLGFLVVGQDGHGRFEANISGALIADRDRLDNGTIVIKSGEGADVSRGELRGAIACGELDASEQGA